MKYILSCLILGVSLFHLNAQGEKSDFKTTSISIFKNGSGFIIKEGTVATSNSAYKMKSHFPTALHGTLWIHSPEGKLKHISSYRDTDVVQKSTPAANIQTMIFLNQDKRMKIWIGEEEVYEGMVESVDTNQFSPESRNQSTLLARSLITFKTDDQWLTLPVSSIRRVSFLEKPDQVLTNKVTETKNILQVDFSNNKPTQKLNMMYLSGGINWSPMYLLELESDKKAHLTLRSELKNDVEDFKNTNLNFVVGVPNFKFATRASALIDFVQNVPHVAFNDFSNVSNSIRSQSIGYGVQESTVSSFDSNATGGVDGQATEDLYFYSLKNVSLKKGGRAHYQLFKDEIEIAHIYEANLPQNQENKGFYQKDFLFTPDNQNKVIHSVKLNNSTKYPWTTGSVMVINKEGETKPISQDLLSYTSIKGHTFVKLTEAPDVRIRHAEKEIAREARVKKHRTSKNYFYDLVTVEGEVKIKNYKAKKIDLNIRRAIIGELLESSTTWLKAERVNRGFAYNATTDVCWETSLEAGKDLVIKYQYKIFVPS